MKRSFISSAMMWHLDVVTKAENREKKNRQVQSRKTVIDHTEPWKRLRRRAKEQQLEGSSWFPRR